MGTSDLCRKCRGRVCCRWEREANILEKLRNFGVDLTALAAGHQHWGLMDLDLNSDFVT